MLMFLLNARSWTASTGRQSCLRQRGFVLIRQTDGAANKEKEPDALYVWNRMNRNQ